MGTRATEIRELGAEIVGVAVTATFSQMAFAKHLGIDFPLLSDWDGEVADAYGVRYTSWRDHRGVAKRSLFVIEPTTRIAYRWVTDDALILPDLDELVTAVQTVGPGSR